MVYQHHQAHSIAGGRPLKHLLIAVRVAKRCKGTPPDPAINSDGFSLFVIDEAYLAFAPQARSAVSLTRDNLIIVRSMTKDYALAGLRLGYVVAHNQALIQALSNARPAWNVNALAQAAGVAALADEAHQQHTLTALQAAKISFVQALQSLGYMPVPSTTHFFLLPVAEPTALRERLLRQGLLVRQCTSFGLPHFVRIATRRPDENELLLQALAAIKQT